VPRSNFGGRLPSTVGAQKITSGTWVFGIQIRFTLNDRIQNVGVKRVSTSKTKINNDLYLMRTSWHYTDAAGFNPSRVKLAPSQTLTKAETNYKALALMDRKDDAPHPKNVYVKDKSICIFDGPGRLNPFADITDPLTTYHIFEVLLKSGAGATLGRLKFHFFMEIKGTTFVHGEKVLP